MNMTRAIIRKLVPFSTLAVSGLLFAIHATAHGEGGMTEVSAGTNFAQGVYITDSWRIRRGGRIYADWAGELDRKSPKTTHPAYPKSAKKSGKTTWRCKECHGWDYKGKDGSYGSGSHFTGIRGVRNAIGMSPGKIEAILRDKTHRYTDEMIPHNEVENLAMFLNLGQVNMDAYINPRTKRANGNAQHGAQIYQTVCAICHGLNGKQINFNTAEDPEYVGTVARDNPWEMLHNIRFGHSGDAMVGLIAFPVRDQVDVLTYVQSLPEK